MAHHSHPSPSQPPAMQQQGATSAACPSRAASATRGLPAACPSASTSRPRAAMSSASLRQQPASGEDGLHIGENAAHSRQHQASSWTRRARPAAPDASAGVLLYCPAVPCPLLPAAGTHTCQYPSQSHSRSSSEPVRRARYSRARGPCAWLAWATKARLRAWWSRQSARKARLAAQQAGGQAGRGRLGGGAPCGLALRTVLKPSQAGLQ